MQFMPPAKLAVFFHLQTVLDGALIFCRNVIPLLTFRTSQYNITPHNTP
jgi:hypothetical protein